METRDLSYNSEMERAAEDVFIGRRAKEHEFILKIFR
jgi:hypothetical protein